jgi:hypothetical protein
MNWGQKLVGFTILFMLFIIGMVVVISRQKMDLVDDNYYEKGIRYQEEMNKFEINDSIQHQVTFDMPNGMLTFTTNIKGMHGMLFFYRPSNATLDFAVPFEVQPDGVFLYKTKELEKGVWKATFEWELNGRKMAAEKQLMIE